MNLNANRLEIHPISPIRGGDTESNQTEVMLKYKYK